MIEARKKPGQVRQSNPTGAGTALANFFIRELDGADGIGRDWKNEDIAHHLGYARPNIVSGWKSGRTKFTLDNVLPMAELLQIDPAYMMALYVEQYAKSGEDIDRFPELVKILGHVVTEEEWEIINYIREVRNGNEPKLTSDVKNQLKKTFEVSPDTPRGPYYPIKQIVPTEGRASPTAIRRGKPRDMSIDQLEMLEAIMEEAKKDKSAEEVVKRSVASVEAKKAASAAVKEAAKAE